MKAYRVRSNNTKYLEMYLDDDELDKLCLDTGIMPEGEVPCKNSWPKDLNGQLYNYEKDNHEGEKPDLTFYDTNLVLNPNAYKKLKNKLKDEGEFLPIHVENETWYLFNVLNYFDEVDKDNCELDIRGGYIYEIKKLAFSEEKLNDQYLFRTHYGEKPTVFCTQMFIDLITELKFSGLIFQTDLTYYGPINLAHIYSEG